jgi:preprotein translocase subunit SecD
MRVAASFSSFERTLKRTLAVLILSTGLAACSTGHSQSGTRFEIHAASLVASPDWQKANLLDDPGTTVYVAPEVLLDNSDVALANAKKDLGGQVLIVIQMTPAGAIRMGMASRVLLRQRMAVMINGEVMTAPVVSAPLSGNRFAITGFRSLEEAQEIALGIAPKK